MSAHSSPATPRKRLRHQDLRDRLDCRFEAIDDVFDDCVDAAIRKLSPLGLEAYLTQAGRLGRLGRGVEPVLTFLEAWPTVAALAGEAAIGPLDRAIQAFQKSPNGRAIAPLLQTLGAGARRLPSGELLADYLALTLRSLWDDAVALVPYAVGAQGPAAITQPYGRPDGLRLPEVLDDWRWNVSRTAASIS